MRSSIRQGGRACQKYKAASLTVRCWQHAQRLRRPIGIVTGTVTGALTPAPTEVAMLLFDVCMAPPPPAVFAEAHDGKSANTVRTAAQDARWSWACNTVIMVIMAKEHSLQQTTRQFTRVGCMLHMESRLTPGFPPRPVPQSPRLAAWHESRVSAAFAD